MYQTATTLVFIIVQTEGGDAGRVQDMQTLHVWVEGVRTKTSRQTWTNRACRRPADLKHRLSFTAVAEQKHDEIRPPSSILRCLFVLAFTPSVAGYSCLYFDQIVVRGKITCYLRKDFEVDE